MGVDPGSLICGVCLLDEEGQIIEAFNTEYPVLWNKVKEYYVKYNMTVVIEDILPYAMRLTPQVIDTCKMIGEMVYRMRKEFKFRVEMVGRYEVKKWVFDSFPEVVTPMIAKKIDKGMFLSCRVSDRVIEFLDGNGKQRRKQSFVYVDDRVVVEAMKVLYSIEMPPPGSGYKYGLKNHSWQALAAASLFIHKVSR